MRIGHRKYVSGSKVRTVRLHTANEHVMLKSGFCLVGIFAEVYVEVIFAYLDRISRSDFRRD